MCSGTSIHLDVKANANVNTNVDQSCSCRLPLGVNADENAIEQSGTLNFPHTLGVRKTCRMHCTQSHSHAAYHVYEILA